MPRQTQRSFSHFIVLFAMCPCLKKTLRNDHCVTPHHGFVIQSNVTQETAAVDWEENVNARN